MYKIMIIDDDTISLSIARAFLEDEYEVTLIHSGQQALGALKSKILPDLILLDMLMPGISGMDMLALLKHDDRLKDIPVIFLTGEQKAEIEVQGYNSGACDFLQKPVDRYLLRIRIQLQLTYTALRRENLELRARLGLPQEQTVI